MQEVPSWYIDHEFVCLRQTLKTVNKENDDLRNLQKTSDATISQLRNQIKELQNTPVTRPPKIEDDNDVRLLQEQLKECRRNHDLLVTQNQELENTVLGNGIPSGSELDSLREQVRDLKNARHDLRNLQKTSDATISQLRNQIKELQNTPVTRPPKREDDNDVRLLQEQLKEFRRNHDRLVEERKELTFELKLEQNKVVTLREQIHSNHVEVTKYIDWYKKKIVELEKEVATLQKDLKEIRANCHEPTVRHWQTVAVTLQGELERLKEKLEDSHLLLEDCHRQVKKKNKDIEKLYECEKELEKERHRRSLRVGRQV